MKKSRSNGIAVEFDQRDDTKVGGGMGEKISYYKRSHVGASGGDKGTVAHDDNRWRNLKMPIFDSEDPMGWLKKIEQYFRLHIVREEDKLEVVMVTMVG